MKRKAFWAVIAALCLALLGLGACTNMHRVQSLFYGMGKAGSAGAIREPAHVDYSVCRVLYGGLSPVQQQAYRAVYNGVRAHPERLALPVMSEAALSEVITAVQLENPQLLCLDEQFSYRVAGQVLWLYPQYRESRAACEARTELLMDAAEELAAQARALKDGFQKELFLHDAICDACEYGDETWADTAYGALVQGCARCGGYTAAMKLLCDMCGISSTAVCGAANAGDADEQHVWNAVALDGVWYFTDVTWDDPQGIGGSRHDYFNVGERELSRSHGGYALPAGMHVPGGSGDYYIRSGVYCTGQNWKSVLRTAVSRAAAGGEVEIKFASSALLREVKTALFENGLLQELARPYLQGTLDCAYSISEDVRVMHIHFRDQVS